MSVGMFDQSKDALQAANVCLPEADFLADDFLANLPLNPYRVEAANDNHRSRPYIPFSPGWYVMCLGDHDLG
jgi:hypothetical protein